MKKLFCLALVLAALGLAGFGVAQETPEARVAPDSKPVPCPIPMPINLSASSGAAPHGADFPAQCSAGYTSTLNWTKADTCFRYTFRWKPLTECCQCISATLTIKYTALQDCQSATSSGAGNDDSMSRQSATSSGACNDSVSLWSNGSAIPGTSQPLYTTFPFNTGQTGSKSIPIKCEWLKNNRLSFIVQDDTAVTSATLNVVGCCVKK